MAVEQHVFLVGGRGTRLGTLTADRPKPMMDVAGRPFIEFLMDQAVRDGAKHIVLLCGYLAGSFHDRYHGADWAGAKVECLVETEPLGTGGPLTAAKPVLAPEFWLANGDSHFEFDRADFAAWRPKGDWLVKMALAHRQDTSASGAVECEDERVTRFLERGPAAPGLINAGVYLISRDILAHIPAGPCSLERDVFPRLAQGGLLRGRAYEGYFIDIGTPAELARARAEFRAEQTPPSRPGYTEC
jgi:D-glycero-D-manno-heptose 1,7-bisphosphate phosphatase